MLKYSRLFFFLILLSASSVMAAKFPNAVAKKIIFKGKEAQEIAALLGIDPINAWDKRLRLHSSNEWAVYLRDTPQPNAASSAVERPRYNTISYVPNPAYLSIEGDWLDSNTGSSPSQPRFLFSSPFIPEGGTLPGWDILLKRHLSTQSVKMPHAVLFEKRLNRFKLTIYRAQDYSKNPKGEWGYEILISAEE